VASLEELRDVLSTLKPGETVRLAVFRDEERQTVELKLGRQPRSP